MLLSILYRATTVVLDGVIWAVTHTYGLSDLGKED